MAFKRVIILALAAALTLSLTACGSGGDSSVQEQTDIGVAVEVETVETAAISNENRVSGRVLADAQTPVMVTANAQVVAVYVEVGDHVQTGDLICALDMSSTINNYNAAVISRDSALQSYKDQAAVFNGQISLYNTQLGVLNKQMENLNAQVSVLEGQLATLNDQMGTVNTQLAMAEKNVSDTEVLLAAGAASQLELDQANLQLDQARLAVQQAQSGIDQATLSLSQAKVGVDQAQSERQQLQLAITSTQAQKNSTLAQLQAGAESYQATVDQLAAVLENLDDSGNVVAPASGIISSLSAVEKGMVSATSPVAVIDEVEEMKVVVSVSEALIPKIEINDAVDVYVGAIGASYTGTVRNAERTANMQTGLYTVTVTVPSNTVALLPGMFADVTFHTDTSYNAIVVPTEAILSGDNNQYVFVVENGTAKYTEVTTGLVGNGVTEILTGLKEGQRLVTVGQSYLHDGDAVRLVSGEE